MKRLETLKAIARADMKEKHKLICMTSLLFDCADLTSLAELTKSEKVRVVAAFEEFESKFQQDFAEVFMQTLDEWKIKPPKVTRVQIPVTELLSFFRAAYFMKYGVAAKITDSQFIPLKRLLATHRLSVIQKDVKEFFASTPDHKKATLANYLQFRKKRNTERTAAKKRATKRVDSSNGVYL